jgi:hypothetical protein
MRRTRGRPHWHPRISPDEAEGLRGWRGRLRPREDALADRLLTAYRAEIPQYAQVSDPFVLDDMTAVSLAGLHGWFGFLEQTDRRRAGQVGGRAAAAADPRVDPAPRGPGRGQGRAAARVPDRGPGRLAGDPRACRWTRS